jgi:uncharacterized membrane protein SpoIIM required for sporulation
MMIKRENKNFFYPAWIKLIKAYLVSFFISLVAGFSLIYGLKVAPEKLLALSTQRLAAAGAVIEKGLQLGIDSGLLLFVWNVSGALATLSFIYTASLINPLNVDRFPRLLRKALCGQKPMKALCFLPGCAKMSDEPLRRLYVWLMVPLLGTLLLGVECGLIVSAVTFISGSFAVGIVSLLPHGIIEIPAFALAGAIPFSAHLLVKNFAGDTAAERVFDQVQAHRRQLPVRNIIWVVVLCLFIAGLIEAHITPFLMDHLNG